MNLRTRITLIACLGVTLLVLGLVLEARLREGNAARQYQAALIEGYRNAWNGVLNAETQRLIAAIDLVNNNSDAIKALVNANRTNFTNSLRDLLVRLRSEPLAPHFEVMDLLGQQFYSSAEDNSVQITSLPLMEAVRRQGGAVTGVFQGKNQQLFIGVAFPLLSRVRPAGLGLFYVAVDRLLPRLNTGSEDEFMVVDRETRVLESTAPALTAALMPFQDRWQDLQGTITLQLPADFMALDNVTLDRNGLANNPVFNLTRLPLYDVFQQPAGGLLIARDISDLYWQTTLLRTLSYTSLAIAFPLFLAGLFWYLRRSFRPLNAMIRVLKALSQGDTTVVVPNRQSNDEIGRLASTVERFRQAQEARNQLHVIRQELDAATQIQSSIRPRSFPDREDMSLHAEMRAAREVGGDFFDFFDLPDGRFGFVMADVSGKGMGAALFMAVARTVIRTTAMILPEPSDCLERANDFLSKDNDTAMFVTVFYGILEPSSGRLSYVNAGHNAPYRLDADGQLETLPGTDSIALGAMEDLPFSQRDIVLHHGDRLVLFTDGVTEAINAQNEEFTTERLKDTLSLFHQQSIRRLVDAVVEAVDNFAGATPQFDDITLMAIAYHPPLPPRAEGVE